ncbi:hypothetical protein PCL_12580 [Purpureocillium lilacinum]|uniref:Uncharacterized protein n=1 Tax=Purpureocillium lilacinum TaxID=33203 RepID=A0A2U3E9N6_PURLI|nr:hypothetical protein PCL_12580 [Purpureocillium lilacinum]
MRLQARRQLQMSAPTLPLGPQAATRPTAGRDPGSRSSMSGRVESSPSFVCALESELSPARPGACPPSRPGEEGRRPRRSGTMLARAALPRGTGKPALASALSPGQWGGHLALTPFVPSWVPRTKLTNVCLHDQDRCHWNWPLKGADATIGDLESCPTMTDPLSRGMLVLAASMLLQCCRRCCCYCGGGGGGGGCLGAALKNAFANGWTQGWLSHSLTKQRQGKVPKTLPRGSPSGLMNAPPESQTAVDKSNPHASAMRNRHIFVRSSLTKGFTHRNTNAFTLLGQPWTSRPYDYSYNRHAGPCDAGPRPLMRAATHSHHEHAASRDMEHYSPVQPDVKTSAEPAWVSTRDRSASLHLSPGAIFWLERQTPLQLEGPCQGARDPRGFRVEMKAGDEGQFRSTVLVVGRRRIVGKFT